MLSLIKLKRSIMLTFSAIIETLASITNIKSPIQSALIYGLTAPFIFTTNVVLYAMQPVGMENISTVLFALQQIVMFIPLLFLLKGYGFIYAISAQPLSEVVGGIVTIVIFPMFIRKTKNYFKRQKLTENLQLK